MLVQYFPSILQDVRPSAQRGPLATVRRIYAQAAWERMSVAERIGHALATLVWPAVAAASSLFWQVPRHGFRARAESGRPVALQVWDQLSLALSTRMWPRHYYMFELYRENHRARAHEYLLRPETKHGVFTILKDAPRKNQAFARKDLFARACAAAGLPHVTAVAVLKDGGISWCGEFEALPPVDLFVKPVAAQGGRGAERWRWRGSSYESAAGARESAEGLLQRLRERSRAEQILVSPCMTNHPALAGLALGALSTLRIVTCRDESHRPETVAAAMRFPRRVGAVVDNFHAGGLAAMVDLRNGKLGAATDIGLSRDSGWHDRHPVSGAPISGFAVPFFREAKVLAEAAHRVLGDRVVVGWDVAILADGPTLVEANSFPDLDIIQRCGRRPLGGARLCELVAFHLRRYYPVWRRRHGLD